MLRLKAWRSCLRRESPSDAIAVLFDHGPIFKLVRLREFGPEFTSSAVYQQWWNRVFREWTKTLDLVIWLDAPDDVLLERIHRRDTRHRIKDRPADEAVRFLSHYRTCYEQIVADWQANGGPRVLRCNTQRETLDYTAEKILATIDEERSACR